MSCQRAPLESAERPSPSCRDMPRGEVDTVPRHRADSQELKYCGEVREGIGYVFLEYKNEDALRTESLDVGPKLRPVLGTVYVAGIFRHFLFRSAGHLALYMPIVVMALDSADRISDDVDKLHGRVVVMDVLVRVGKLGIKSV